MKNMRSLSGASQELRLIWSSMAVQLEVAGPSAPVVAQKPAKPVQAPAPGPFLPSAVDLQALRAGETQRGVIPENLQSLFDLGNLAALEMWEGVLQSRVVCSCAMQASAPCCSRDIHLNVPEAELLDILEVHDVHMRTSPLSLSGNQAPLGSHRD